MQLRNTNITKSISRSNGGSIINGYAANLFLKDFVRFEGNEADEGGAVRIE